MQGKSGHKKRGWCPTVPQFVQTIGSWIVDILIWVLDEIAGEQVAQERILTENLWAGWSEVKSVDKVGIVLYCMVSCKIQK